MRIPPSFRLFPVVLIPVFVAAAQSMVADRVAVVINKTIITQSELEDDLRLTEFINGQPLDLGPLARREAAEHLVDQQLIRQEIENAGYARPDAGQAAEMLRQFRQQHYPSDAAYHAALQKYGVTEDQLKQRLLWQLTAIQFTDFRFRPLQAAEAQHSADRSTTDGSAPSVDQQLDAWLKQARSDANVVMKPEAFR